MSVRAVPSGEGSGINIWGAVLGRAGMLESIVDSLRVGLIMLDAEGKHIAANRAFTEMTGFSEEELLGQFLPLRYWGREDMPRIANALKSSGGGPSTWNLMFRRKNGDAFEALVTTSGYEDPARGPVFVATVQDISRRVEAENLFQYLARSCEAAVYMLEDGQIQMANPRLAKLCEYRYESLLGMDFLGLVHPEDRGKIREDLALLSAAEPGFTLEHRYRLVTRGGLTRQVMETAVCVEYRGKRSLLASLTEGTDPPHHPAQQRVGAHSGLMPPAEPANNALVEVSSATDVDPERLYEISRLLASSLDLETVLEQAVAGIAHALDRTGLAISVTIFSGGGQLSHSKTVHVGVPALGGGHLDPVAPLTTEDIDRLMRESCPLRLGVHPDPDRPGSGGVADTRKDTEAMTFPLLVGDRCIGAIVIRGRGASDLGTKHMAFLEACAQSVALAVDNARLYATADSSLSRRIDELEALTGIVGAAADRASLETMLADMLRRAASALRVDQAAVLLRGSRDWAVISLFRADGTAARANLDTRVKVNMSQFAGGILRRGEALVVEDMASLPNGPEAEFLRRLGASSALVTPMMSRGNPMGLLVLSTDARGRRYTVEEMSLARAIAGHMGAIAENARLRERTDREKSTLESIISSMGEGLLVIDSQGVLLYCNPAAERLMGLAASDFVGRPASLCYDALSPRVAAPQDWRATLSGWPEATQHKFDLVLQIPDRREVEGTFFSIRGHGTLLGTGMVLRDVTREREVDRMKSEFVSLASHELRTPMTAIYGFSELLMSRAPEINSEHASWVNSIGKESRRLLAIVEDMLDVSRIETGNIALQVQKVLLQPLADDIVKQAGHAHSRHTFDVLVPPDFPPVLADPGKLEQVLYNLVDNAAKYSPGGQGVEVRARIDGDGRARISVADQGIGIPEEEIPRLFTRFHRVRRPETAGLRGTGLGLYIARSLMEAMGGDIQVESRLGRGTVFHLRLPVALMSGSAGAK